MSSKSTIYNQSFLTVKVAAFFTTQDKNNFDPARIRTWNPLIRSQMPYPLGHGACYS